ncbi:uncharacterized protein LOC106653244 [Trichogramma pretiosum]|uniref:uncharacterized protein LOC106653244 n=1 Tax=Trichogramma pretiosum TaxID=7493 RepID=UPI0006C997F3|nr:uncharacterized protein LOC106653244 [Trichogramma pretiosum]
MNKIVIGIFIMSMIIVTLGQQPCLCPKNLDIVCDQFGKKYLNPCLFQCELKTRNSAIIRRSCSDFNNV